LVFEIEFLWACEGEEDVREDTYTWRSDGRRGNRNESRFGGEKGTVGACVEGAVFDCGSDAAPSDGVFVFCKGNDFG